MVGGSRREHRMFGEERWSSQSQRTQVSFRQYDYQSQKLIASCSSPQDRNRRNRRTPLGENESIDHSRHRRQVRNRQHRPVDRRIPRALSSIPHSTLLDLYRHFDSRSPFHLFSRLCDSYFDTAEGARREGARLHGTEVLARCHSHPDCRNG